MSGSVLFLVYRDEMTSEISKLIFQSQTFYILKVLFKVASSPWYRKMDSNNLTKETRKKTEKTENHGMWHFQIKTVQWTKKAMIKSLTKHEGNSQRKIHLNTVVASFEQFIIPVRKIVQDGRNLTKNSCVWHFFFYLFWQNKQSENGILPFKNVENLPA